MAKLSAVELEKLIDGLETVISTLKKSDADVYNMSTMRRDAMFDFMAMKDIVKHDTRDYIGDQYEKCFKETFGFLPESFSQYKYKSGISSLQARVVKLFTVAYGDFVKREVFICNAEKVLLKLETKLEDRKS